MHRLVRQGAQVAAGACFLSWFALYLEIFRWHHVLPSRLASVVWPTAGINQPGWFVRTIVACSALAPLVSLTFAAARWKYRARSRRDTSASVESRFGAPEAVAVFGGALSVLGAINQAVRHPPLVVDLTLQHGNVGFVALGVTLLAGAFLMQHRKRRAVLGPSDKCSR